MTWSRGLTRRASRAPRRLAVPGRDLRRRVLWAGVEECDDANDDDDDACVSTCMIAFCGDGFVQITAGQHTLKFEYDKDISLSAGADSIWVDDLQIVP